MLSRASRRDKLKELKEARQAGSSLITYSDGEDDQGIYDEVDEETYRERKRNQMMNDDFIVDDNGEGYVDNGVDEWDDSTRPKYYSDEEEEGTGKKRKKNQKKPVKVAKTSEINNFFKSGGFTSSKVTAPKRSTPISMIFLKISWKSRTVTKSQRLLLTRLEYKEKLQIKRNRSRMRSASLLCQRGINQKE